MEPRGPHLALGSDLPGNHLFQAAEESIVVEADLPEEAAFVHAPVDVKIPVCRDLQQTVGVEEKRNHPVAQQLPIDHRTRL
jgi:hypothetical protein